MCAQLSKHRLMQLVFLRNLFCILSFRFKRNLILYLIIIYRPYSPIEARVCQPTASLTFTCLQTEIKDHSASLGVIKVNTSCSLSRCWITIPGLQINYYPNVSLYMVGTNPVCRETNWDHCVRGSDSTSASK